MFAAFFVSPTSECLGPILELNVSDNETLNRIYFHQKHFFFQHVQGLLTAIPLSYILPGLIFIKLDPSSLFSQEKLPAIFLVLFGVAVSVSGEQQHVHMINVFGNKFINFRMFIGIFMLLPRLFNPELDCECLFFSRNWVLI